jgi:hypothetical protein
MLANLYSDEVFLIVSIVIAVINYIFKAIGLFVLAKRNKLSIKWFAFIPFANNYLLGRLTGEINLINVKIKNTGLMVLLTELIKFIFTMAYYVLYLLPVIKDVIAGAYTPWQFLNGTVNPTLTASSGVQLLSAISSILSLGFIFLFVSVLISFFRKYAPANYMVYSIVSLFLSVEGIFIFILRNKEEVNYNEYLKKKYSQYRQNQNQNPYNPYNPYNRGNNPYEPYNPYNKGQGMGNMQKPDEPFKEFSEKQESNPFSDIFGNDTQKEKHKEEEKPEKKDDDIFH